jgi:parallel beta-helix repeat protein
MLTILMFTSSLLFGSAHRVRSAGPYTVNLSTDGHDSAVGDGNCYDGVSGCTLRAAIEQASADGVPTTINFATGLLGQTLYLANVYGQIDWPGNNITVDGDALNITISGQLLAAGQSVFRIRGNSNTLEYLTIRDAKQDGIQVGDFFNAGTGNNNTIAHVVLIGNVAAGVYVHGSSAGGGGGNTIDSSMIGIKSVSNTACVAGEGNGYDGIFVDGGADNTTITNNIIVCNGNNGVYIYDSAGSTISSSSIYNNNIGAYGVFNSYDMGNGLNGVHDYKAFNTQIDSNTISGNGGSGVWLEGSSSADVLRSKIGVDSNGNFAVPNDWYGVYISGGAINNIIGKASYRNVISGNTLSGVYIYVSDNNTVDSNYIGVNGSGSAAIPNGNAGVAIVGSTGNIISDLAGETQIISGNTREGVYVEDSNQTRIRPPNCIGVASDCSTPLGNGLQGVMLYGSKNSMVAPTIVANNGGAGVAVEGNASAVGNQIQPGTIHSNGGLPIDLGNNGATVNDVGDGDTGPNNLLNYPVITGASGSNISGTTCNNCVVVIYSAIGNPAAVGGGGQYLQFVFADSSGNWNTALSGGLTAVNVTMTSCDGACGIGSNTSEMSPRPTTYLPIVRR